MNDKEIKEILDNTLEYLEGIDETRNTKILTTNEANILLDYITNLQSNWNSLREWLEEQIKLNLDGVKSYSGYQCKETLDKMNKLEGKDNNGE